MDRNIHDSSFWQNNSNDQEIDAIIESAPFPIAIYYGREMLIKKANTSVIDTWGKGPNVIGKTYYEVLPELKETGIFQKLDAVFMTGVPYHEQNSKVELIIDGHFKSFFFNYSFTPLFNKEGKVYGIMNTAADVTDLNEQKQRAEYSERNFREMILQAPVAMCLLKGPQFIIDLANEAMIGIWGKKAEAIMGLPVFEALPDARDQGLEEVMKNVYRTGTSFTARELPVALNRHGRADTVYQNFSYQPYRNLRGDIIGVLATSVDVSEQVRMRQDREKAYEQIRLSKTAAQLGTFDMDLINGTMEWDPRCRELFGISHNDKVTYEDDFVGGLHPDDRLRITSLIDTLMQSESSGGDYDVEYRTIGTTDNQLRWVRAKGRVYYESGKPVRFIGSVLDITAQKNHELELLEVAERQARFAAVINSSDDIIISKTLDGIITSWNPAAERAFGYSETEAVGCHISIIIPKERFDEEKYIISQIRKGQKVDHFETVRKTKDGRPVYLSLTVSPIIDESGTIIGASKIARDIAMQRAAQQTSEQYTRRLEIMNMVMSSVSEELDLSKILQKVTDATTELTGAGFGAFFYNKIDKQGESYTLFTLSGAPREAFEKFGMPRNTAVFHPTFSGEGVVRVDDITKDPKYGKNHPHQGMPEGHLPVASYLAVPVTSRSGQVIGGLFFGHPEPKKFTAEHETLVISIAAQTAISLDNAKLFEEVLALNDKKDEFIGLASHELKTPLASISGYLQILKRFVTEERPTLFLQKALAQSSKLAKLVNDLLDVSKIEAGKLQLTIANFDLTKVIQEAIELFEHSENTHVITFRCKEMECPVRGDSQRIEQVVINLLSNAIKYAPNAGKVEISLVCTEENVTVAVKDFGPGIAPDKLKNIFARFYRIDEASPNISGLGIGLYLSHEIINRHHGSIWVESTLGSGSTFYFSLPFAYPESN